MLCLRVWGGDLLPGRGGEPRAGSGALTSTSQRALELVADVADWRSVVRRNTCSLPLYSSHVRNFSCSAWNSRTTSPCRRAVGSGWPGTLPADEPPISDAFQSQQAHGAPAHARRGRPRAGETRCVQAPAMAGTGPDRAAWRPCRRGHGAEGRGPGLNCGEAWVRGESTQRICAHGPFPENKVSSAKTGSGWSRGFKPRDGEEASRGGWGRPCGVGGLGGVWSQRRGCMGQGPDREQSRVPGRWMQGCGEPGMGGTAGEGVFPVLTPFSTSSRWSRNCMNRLIFQLVLQFTELTWGSTQRPMRLGRPPAPRSRQGLRPRAGEGRPAQRPLMSIGRGCLPLARAPRPQPSCPGAAALWAGECGQMLGDRKGVREAHPGPPAVDRTRGSNPVGRECVDTPPLQRQPNETTN